MFILNTDFNRNLLIMTIYITVLLYKIFFTITKQRLRSNNNLLAGTEFLSCQTGTYSDLALTYPSYNTLLKGDSKTANALLIQKQHIHVNLHAITFKYTISPIWCYFHLCTHFNVVLFSCHLRSVSGCTFLLAFSNTSTCKFLLGMLTKSVCQKLKNSQSFAISRSPLLNAQIDSEYLKCLE